MRLYNGIFKKNQKIAYPYFNDAVCRYLYLYIYIFFFKVIIYKKADFSDEEVYFLIDISSEYLNLNILLLERCMYCFSSELM